VNNYYDIYFKIYALEFFEKRVDWRLFKAMGMAESALNPEAVSPVGAFGVMQLMPDTSAWISRLSGIPNTPKIPHLNIKLGICYAYHCYTIWQAESAEEKIPFMCASYNAGPGNIINAQRQALKRGLNPALWRDVSTCLSAVTGRHADETINYVRRIIAYKEQLTDGSV